MNLSNLSFVSFGDFKYPSVKKLNLSQTAIKNINADTFPNLEVLDISNALYKQYSRIKSYSKLKEVIVDKNKYNDVKKFVKNIKVTVKE